MVNPELRKTLPPLQNKDDIFTKMALLFIESYEEIERLICALEYNEYTRDYIASRVEYAHQFPARYLEIIKEYQEQLFAQPAEEVMK